MRASGLCPKEATQFSARESRQANGRHGGGRFAAATTLPAPLHDKCCRDPGTCPGWQKDTPPLWASQRMTLAVGFHEWLTMGLWMESAISDRGARATAADRMARACASKRASERYRHCSA